MSEVAYGTTDDGVLATTIRSYSLAFDLDLPWGLHACWYVEDVREADIVFSNNISWDTSLTALPESTSGGQYNLKAIAIHELGHVAGLQHENRWLATMGSGDRAYFGINRDLPMIHSDDKAGLRFLYGDSTTGTDIAVNAWKQKDTETEYGHITYVNQDTYFKRESSSAFEITKQTWDAVNNTFTSATTAAPYIFTEVTLENHGTDTVNSDIGVFIWRHDSDSPTWQRIDNATFSGIPSGHVGTWPIYALVSHNLRSAGYYKFKVQADSDSLLNETNELNNEFQLYKKIYIDYPYLVTLSKGGGGSINAVSPLSVYSGSTASFTVTPDVGYHATVVGCNGTLTGNTYTTGPIAYDCTVSATFSNKYTLNIITAGSGIVTSSPAGISCGTTCSADIISGTTVTLTATPGPGSYFQGWAFAGCSGTGKCIVPMDANYNIVALFGLAPAAPTGLTVTAVSSTQINLSWTDNTTDESGYIIERKLGEGGTYKSIRAMLGPNVTSFTETSLTPGMSYFYRVRAYNPAGYSQYSNEANATTFPTNLITATAVSASQINLSWADLGLGSEDYYVIERKTGAGGTYAPIAMTEEYGNVTSYTDTGLLQNTTYFYRVSAYYNGIFFVYTSEVNATTIQTDLTAEAASATQINLSWTDINNETNYVIERKTGTGGTYAQIAIVGANVTSYASRGLLQNTTYFYRVRAYYNGVGYSGSSNEANATTLTPATPIYSQISAGSAHNVAIKSDGTMWVWGANGSGQLGNGTTDEKIHPVQIGTGSTWISATAGMRHSVAVKSDGSLWTWGYNALGELGDGTQDGKLTPTKVGTENTWVSVTAGLEHTLALKSDGTLWAWGYNFKGQLGDGSIQMRTAPVPISGGNTWVAVSAGYFHNMALKSDGTLWAWGSDSMGALGDGSGMVRTSPVQIGVGSTWVSASAGIYGHTLAVKSNGTLWAWGNDFDGQLGLGDGTPISVSTPTQVGGETTWASVAAGGGHSAAMKTDGSLSAWGYNDYGQVGDGSKNNNKTAPVQIGAGSTWVLVDAGDNHTIALKSDGTLWAWGANASGQLGDGTETEKLTPTLVSGNGRLLMIAKAGLGTGTITSPAGINCGTDCKEPILLNSVVTLTAVPDANMGFAGWFGRGCSGTGPCTVTMNDDITVTATFDAVRDNYGLWVYDGTDDGVVPWDTCNGDQTAEFTCPLGVELNCTDIVEDNDIGLPYEIVWRYRIVTCVSVPSGLTATAASATQVNLSWTDESNNETGFAIERKTGDGGTYAQIATVAANVKAYTNTGLTASTLYYYRVRATKSSGSTAYSNEASATTSAACPANGDVNGDGVVDAGDAVVAQRITLGVVTATSEQLCRGDVVPTGAPDGVINAADAVVIQRKAMGLQ